MSLLDTIDTMLPRWMLTAPRQHVGKLMGAFLATMDALALQVFEARLAGLPGQTRNPGVEGQGGFDSNDALPLIGRDRSIRAGLSELPWDYASRLRAWMDSWAMAGTPVGLLLQLQGVMGGAAGAGVIRIVSAGGDWYTLDGTVFTFQNATQAWSLDLATGTLTAAALAVNAFDLDSASVPAPPDQNDPGRFFVIVRAPLNPPWCAGQDGTYQDMGLYGDFWNDPMTYFDPTVAPTAGTLGLLAPKMWVDLARNVIADFKPAGIICKLIVVIGANADPNAFDPILDSTPTSVPGGTWAWHTRYDSGTHSRVVARYPLAEYIPGD